jgi:hypothetical protein
MLEYRHTETGLCCPSHDTLGMRLLPIGNVASRSASFRMILTQAFLTPTACRRILRGEFFRENRGWGGERSQSAHSAPASARRFHDTGDDARGCVSASNRARSPANEVRADGQLARKVSVRAAPPERSWACPPTPCRKACTLRCRGALVIKPRL